MLKMFGRRVIIPLAAVVLCFCLMLGLQTQAQADAEVQGYIAKASATATPKPVKASTSKRIGYVRTTGNANMRTGPGSKYGKVLTIPTKQELPYYAYDATSGSAWYYVKYNGKYGWVSAGSLKEITVTSSPTTKASSSSSSKKDAYTVTYGSTSMEIYPAEMIDWYKGGINGLFRKGVTYKVYDVKTKKIWCVRRTGGTAHADVEPATAKDTAVLCKIYGVSSAQEIADKNLYARRPCLITIGKHTYACSLYGIPHGTSTISGNKMDGQVCLHFTNSKTHGTKKVDSGHQTAIRYAYNHAPNGQKK